MCSTTSGIRSADVIKSRNVEDQRAVNHVTEIYDTGDIVRRRHDEIVLVQIGMNHLRSQCIEARKYAFGEATDHIRRETLLQGVFKRIDVLEVFRGHSQIPEQFSS